MTSMPTIMTTTTTPTLNPQIHLDTNAQTSSNSTSRNGRRRINSDKCSKQNYQFKRIKWNKIHPNFWTVVPANDSVIILRFRLRDSCDSEEATIFGPTSTKCKVKCKLMIERWVPNVSLDLTLLLPLPPVDVVGSAQMTDGWTQLSVHLIDLIVMFSQNELQCTAHKIGGDYKIV